MIYGLRCLTKKAVLQVSTLLVDFGPGITLGQSCSRGITLSNEGALEVEYTIRAVRDQRYHKRAAHPTLPPSRPFPHSTPTKHMHIYCERGT